MPVQATLCAVLGVPHKRCVRLAERPTRVAARHARWRCGAVARSEERVSTTAEAVAAAAAAFPEPHVQLISSTSNAYVKHAVKLRTSRAYRDATQSVLLVGSQLLSEVAADVAREDGRSSLRMRLLLLAEGAPTPAGLCPDRLLRASRPVLAKLAGVENGDGVDAVAELQQPSVRSLSHAHLPAFAAATRLLLLEGVQDPGNLGTLLRSAVAFGWHACVLLPGCCDPFNDKAVRASRGAALRLPLWRASSWADMQHLRASLNASCLAASPAGDPSGSAIRLAAAQSNTRPIWLLLGAEGQGLSAEALHSCTSVAIPGAQGFESLNVGVAGSVLMFALRQQGCAEG